MMGKRRGIIFLAVVTLIFTLTGCGEGKKLSEYFPANLLSSQSQTQLPSITSSPTNTATHTPTYTPAPTETPTFTPTITPTPLMIYPVQQGTPFPNPTDVITSANASSVKQLAVFGQGFYKDVQWSPDGRYLVITSTVGAFLYDGTTMKLVLTVPSQQVASESPVSPAVVFSKNSQYFVIASTEGVFVYELPSLKMAASIFFTGKDEIPSDVAFFPDNVTIAVSLNTGVVEIYSIQEQKQLQIIGSAAEKHSIYQVQISGDGNTLVWWNGTWKGSTIQTWNLLEGKSLPLITSDVIDKVAVSNDGATLAVEGIDASYKTSTSLWDTKTGSSVSFLHSTIFRAYSQTTDMLALQGFSSRNAGMGYFICPDQIAFYNLSTRKIVRTLTGSGGYSTVTFSPDGTQAAASWGGPNCGVANHLAEKREIRIWDIATGKLVGEHIDHGVSLLDKLTISPDNRVAGLIHQSFGELNQVLLWDKLGEEPIQPIKRTGLSSHEQISLEGLNVDLRKVSPGPDPVMSFVITSPTLLSPDLNYRLSMEGENYKLFDNRNGTMIQDFGNAAVAGFSADSKLVVVFKGREYSEASQLEIWDIRSNKRLRSMDFLARYPRYIQFSSDGTKFITISSDQTTRIWGVASQAGGASFVQPTVSQSPAIKALWPMKPAPPPYDFNGWKLGWHYGSPPSFTKSDGVLSLQVGSGFTDFEVKMSDSSRSITRMQVFEERMKLSSIRKDGNAFMQVAIFAAISDGSQKIIECRISISNIFRCQILSFSPNGDFGIENAFEINVEADQWYTVRIEMDPGTAALQFYLDGTLVNVYVPQDAEKWLQATYSPSLKLYAQFGSIQGYVDNVRITP